MNTDGIDWVCDINEPEEFRTIGREEAQEAQKLESGSTKYPFAPFAPFRGY